MEELDEKIVRSDDRNSDTQTTELPETVSAADTVADDTVAATVTDETAENETAAVAAGTAEGNVGQDKKDGDGSAAANVPQKKKGIKAWWARHKPSKRRFIQIYSLLLYNAYIRGFVKGDIFKGVTKTVCVPGLNCYSCPGAIGACPLGALQNALTATGHSAPYFMLGIILLYGLIFGRTVCGFLCPVGLGQDLLYKVRSPKLMKSRVTRVLSYLKYVILAVLVIGIPIIYAVDSTVVPGFCKYICPAGTLEGAFMLLLHPTNDSLFASLGPLFTWKTVVLICIITGSIFIYRVFCRFLCPLGAIYGLFNKFALLGIKVERSKCTECGKCISKCKMDVKKVGDHECINCGECIDVCPTKAISFKGGKVFMNNVDTSLVQPAAVDEPASAVAAAADVSDGIKSTPSAVDIRAVRGRSAAGAVAKPRRGRTFWMRVTAIVLAAALLVGMFTYVNFFAADGADDQNGGGTTYMLVVDTADGQPGEAMFTINGREGYIVPKSGSGTQDDPYKINRLDGKFDVPIDGGAVYFVYTAKKAGSYNIEAAEGLSLDIYYVLSGAKYALYDYEVDGSAFTLDLKRPIGYGNKVGDTCYDFTLDGYNGAGKVTLSEHRGRVTVVNFWGTWCGPCVKELPHFEAVRSECDYVDVIAIHSVMGSQNGKVEKHLAKEGWNSWGIIFAQDRGTDAVSEVYKLLGGNSNNAYPRTLVIDANGIIRYAVDGAISKAELKAKVEEARAYSESEVL